MFVINNNVCAFDFPVAVFVFFDFQKLTIGIDITALFDKELAVFLCNFNISFARLKIVDSSNDERGNNVAREFYRGCMWCFRG
jgi:hypothetical protein